MRPKEDKKLDKLIDSKRNKFLGAMKHQGMAKKIKPKKDKTVY